MGKLNTLRSDALEIFRAALRAADPQIAIRRVLRRDGKLLYLNDTPIFEIGQGRVLVVGTGKAGARMAQAVEEILPVTAGAVTVKYEHIVPTSVVKMYEAGHPLPDANGVRGTQAIVELLRGVSSNDLVLCVISGGGSALMEWLVEGVTLDDLRALTHELLRCGATITEINTLRKHLSRVKGGQLARLAQPASIVALILSDVLGSPVDIIASGPTAPDLSTFADCIEILDRHALYEKIPLSIVTLLERGARGEIADTPKADDPLFARVTNVIIADNQIACEAAAQAARARGYHVKMLSTHMQGEAREIGSMLGQLARRKSETEGPDTTGETRSAPTCWLGGGEPTVKLHGHGKGGRAQELVLAAAPEIAGDQEAVVLSAGTDGTDGPTDAAGALADNTTLARAHGLGLDPQAFMDNNDSYHFFAALHDLVITGPTNTNVNDLVIALSDTE